MQARLKKKLFILHYFFIGLTLASGIVTFYLWHRYQQKYHYFFNQSKNEAEAQVREAAKYLSEHVQLLKPLATELAQIIGSQKLNQAKLDQLLKKKKPDEIAGLGVAFLPYKFDPTKKLFSRSYAEQEGELIFKSFEDAYDYTSANIKWFHNPLKNGPGFNEPFFNKANMYLAEYGVPIMSTTAAGKKEPIGVAFANQSVQHLQHILDTLFLGNNGYWFILTETGSFLAYPQLTYKNKTIFDIAKDLNNPDLADAAKKIIAGKLVEFEYENEITGDPSWLISNPIKGTKWNLVGVFDQGETGLDYNQMRHKLIFFSLACLCTLISMVLAFATVYPTWMHTTSFGLSMALLTQICIVWYASYHYPFRKNEPNIYHVTNKSELYQFMKDKFLDSKNFGKTVDKEDLLAMKPHSEYVPTGIYLNELQFNKDNEIEVSGYIWQRLTKGIHDKVIPGFIFSQTNNAKITLESKVPTKDTEIYTYDFFAKINQFLTYARYPFDAKQLRIKYWSKTSSQNFYFVHDLDSYHLLNPSSFPGIDPSLYLPGWTILNSNFGYESLPYTTNWGWYQVGPYGIFEEDDPSGEPQPFFEIDIRRDLVDTLISDLLPIAVIVVLLYLVLLSDMFDNNRYITAIASVFFATIFAHIRFRGKIQQSQVVYLESLYFILYGIMLLILALLYLSTQKIKIRYLTTYDNYIPKIMFWPLFFGLFMIATLVYLW